jgi:hypothetical protein
MTLGHAIYQSGLLLVNKKMKGGRLAPDLDPACGRRKRFDGAGQLGDPGRSAEGGDGSSGDPDGLFQVAVGMEPPDGLFQAIFERG